MKQKKEVLMKTSLIDNFYQIPHVIYYPKPNLLNLKNYKSLQIILF